MELKTFFAQDLQGNAIQSPTVYIYTSGTTTPISGLQDAAGSALANPFTGGTDGKIVVAAPTGQYDLRVTGGGRDYTIPVQFIDLAETLAAAEAAMAAILDSFDDRYLGAKSSDPSVDNDGNALVTGALYFNSSVGEMRVRTAGGTWVNAGAGAGYLPLTGGTLTGQLTIQAADAVGRRYSDTNGPFNQSLDKARGSSSVPSIVQDGDGLGLVRMRGWDGAGFIEAARILAQVDGTPGTNDMPGRLVFATTADGAASPTERMRIASTGTITIPGDCLFGTTTPGTDTAKVDIVDSTGRCLSLSNSTSDATLKGAFIGLRHYTNSEEGVALIGGFAQSADNSVRIGGGSATQNAATEVGIYTATNNTTLSGTKRWGWNSTGDFFPNADNTYNIGSASLGVKEIFADNGTINTSDARRKTEVQPLTANELAASIALAREIGSFKFLEAISLKGEEDARLHIGMTVQKAIAIMQSHGLDPMAYSFICYDSWGDELGEVETTADDPEGEARTREIPRTRTKETTGREVRVIDGVPTLVEETSEVEVPLYEDRPVVDQNGEPVLGEDGEQMIFAVPVVDTITEYFKTAVIRPAGDKYSFRVQELLLFIARGMDARLAALEAA